MRIESVADSKPDNPHLKHQNKKSPIKKTHKGSMIKSQQTPDKEARIAEVQRMRTRKETGE